MLAAAMSLALLFVAPACGNKKPVDTGPRAMHPVAQKKWITLCVNCHHTDGSGSGPGSKTLNPKPRDFRSAKWQDSVTDEHLAKVIVKGGAATGLSKDMPANLDLMAKKKAVSSLIDKIRSFRSAAE